jgi:hypothetical protein
MFADINPPAGFGDMAAQEWRDIGFDKFSRAITLRSPSPDVTRNALVVFNGGKNDRAWARVRHSYNGSNRQVKLRWSDASSKAFMVRETIP